MPTNQNLTRTGAPEAVAPGAAGGCLHGRMPMEQEGYWTREAGGYYLPAGLRPTCPAHPRTPLLVVSVWDKDDYQGTAYHCAEARP